jgi:FKBP-type peptidyl-prolyl cis-trans isomerase
VAEAKSGTPSVSEKEKRGYALGVQLGYDVARQGLELDPQQVLEGLRDFLVSHNVHMTVEEINATLAAMQKEQLDKAALTRKEWADRADKSRKQGEDFLAANVTKEGVVSLPSGLQYKVLKAGSGQKPTIDDSVVCNYRGTLIDGTEIDSSYGRHEPSRLPLKGVIKGWSEALQLMPVGSRWQIVLPPGLAYGERGSHKVAPNSTLIFEVELLSIVGSAELQGAGPGEKPRGRS